MPAKQLPPTQQLITMHESGMTYQQIADKLAADGVCYVTAMAVNMACLRAGHETRNSYPDMLPWKIATAHNQANDAKMLRLAARRKHGNKMTEREQLLLESWEKALREAGAVVHYDYDHGFMWVHARAGVDTGLIREPRRNERTRSEPRQLHVESVESA